jgi:hypothetical protein
MAVLKYSAETDFPPTFKNYLDIAEWAKENTPDSSVICCRKEEMFYLYSNRTTATFLRTLNTEEQLAYLQKGDIDYVVIDALGYTDVFRYLVPTVQKYKPKFKLIKEFQKPNTYLLQIVR